MKNSMEEVSSHGSYSQGTWGRAEPSGHPSSPGNAAVVQALLTTHDDVEPAAQVIRFHVHNLGRQGIRPACP